MGEGRDRGKEWGGKENVRKNGNARKKYPQNATDLAFGDIPWGLPPRVIYFFWKNLFRQHFHRRYYTSILNPLKVKQL